MKKFLIIPMLVAIAINLSAQMKPFLSNATKSAKEATSPSTGKLRLADMAPSFSGGGAIYGLNSDAKARGVSGQTISGDQYAFTGQTDKAVTLHPPDQKFNLPAPGPGLVKDGFTTVPKPKPSGLPKKWQELK